MVNADGSFTYTPARDANGADSFTFRANDGTATSDAVVSITVNAVNDGPVAQAGTLNTAEDTPQSGTLVATDVDSPSLTYSVVAQGTKGTVTITDASTGAYTYTPAQDANGADSFTFKASDGTTDSNVATVTIAATPVNDTPVRSSASPALAAVDEDSFNVTAVPLGLGGLTYAPGPITATDESSQTLTIRITGIPSFVTVFNGSTQRRPAPSSRRRSCRACRTGRSPTPMAAEH